MEHIVHWMAACLLLPPSLKPGEQTDLIASAEAIFSQVVHCSVIDRDAALGHHLFQVPEAQIVGEIPADTEQDYRSIKMPALKHVCLRYCDISLGS